MSFQRCVDEITKAAGRPLDAEEMEDLIEELERRIGILERIGGLEDLETRVRRAADEYGKEMAAAAIIEKRNAALALKARLESLDKINTQFASNPALGLESVLVGVNTAARGSRNSAALAQELLRNYYMSGLYSDFRKAGVLDLFNSGAMDREVSRALFAINRKEKAPVNVPKEAVQIAEVIAKWQEVSRLDANSAGAWIRKLEGYITRQSHDSFKISRAGYKAWRDFILPKLDMTRTLDGERDIDEFLTSVYKGLSSGVHLKTPDQKPSGFKGPRNIAKKMSAERVLHFKDADAWFDYNAEFGVGSLRESVTASLSRAAQDTGLMRVLGPNPEANFGMIIDQLKRGIKDPDKLAKFNAVAAGKLQNRFAEVSGLTRMPVNHIVASRSGTVRAVQNMAKLGGAVLAQFGDVAFYGSEMRYQGRGMLSGMAESLAAVGKRVKAKERAEFYGALGVYFESMSGHMVDRFSIADDGLPGAVAKGQQLFFTLNGMRLWAERQRAAAVSAFSHHLALKVGKDFAGLGPDLSRTLSLFGIGADQWDIIRKAVETAEDGRRYVTPTAVENLPDEVFADFVTRGGMKPTPARIATARREIADQLRGYFVDRATFAQLSPDARTRSVANQGTRPGTVVGELLRFVMQFKSFSIAAVQKGLGRELYGRGAAADATFLQALRSGNGELAGLANLIVYSAVMGYGAMAAKDLAKGRTPRDPLDHKTWMAAITQGGGLGIYGDFLFGEANRFGGGLLQTAAGPTLGTVKDLHEIYNRVRNGDDAAAATFRFALNNTPFMNLFYTRIVMDYLILWRMQEALSPGSLRRMERRVEKENGQTFLVRPSQAAQ